MMACLALSGAAPAAPPAPPPSADPAGATGSQAPPPDESLIEFLGSDDVDDAGVWEYLTRKPPPSPPPPAHKAGAQDEGQ